MLFNALVVSLMVAVANAQCGNSHWAVAYNPERCRIEGGAAVVSCLSPRGADCGTRMSSYGKFGAGTHSVKIKAAPGAGVATTFYMSNNGGLYDKSRTHPWVELDFELMGKQAGATSKIWTNFFTGVAQEHYKEVTVLFDTSAAMHEYAFQITDKSVKWMVDGAVIREEDISQYPDVVANVHGSSFQQFVSVWGKSASDEGEGIPIFRQELGLLNQNSHRFPVTAAFAPWQPR